MSSVSEFMETLSNSKRDHTNVKLSVDISDFAVDGQQVTFPTSEPYRYIKIALLRKCVIEGKIYEPKVDEITQTITINNTQ